MPTVLTLVTPDAHVDRTAFALWLSALLHVRGDDLVQAKGDVPTPAGRFPLQAVRKVVRQPEALPGATEAADGAHRPSCRPEGL